MLHYHPLFDQKKNSGSFLATLETQPEPAETQVLQHILNTTRKRKGPVEIIGGAVEVANEHHPG